MITSELVRSVRPSGGLAPDEIDSVLGRVADRDLDQGDPITWDVLRPARPGLTAVSSTRTENALRRAGTGWEQAGSTQERPPDRRGADDRPHARCDHPKRRRRPGHRFDRRRRDRSGRRSELAQTCRSCDLHDLADDHTPTAPVITHAIDALAGQGDAGYDFVLVVYPTAIFTRRRGSSEPPRPNSSPATRRS